MGDAEMSFYIFLGVIVTPFQGERDIYYWYTRVKMPWEARRCMKFRVGGTGKAQGP